MSADGLRAAMKCEPVDSWPLAHSPGFLAGAQLGSHPSFMPTEPPYPSDYHHHAPADGISRCPSAFEPERDPGHHAAIPQPGDSPAPPTPSKPRRACAGATLQALAHAADSASDDAAPAPAAAAPKRSQRKRASKNNTRLGSPTATSGRGKCAFLGVLT